MDERRNVRPGHIEPRRIQHVIVVVIDPPEDLINGGEPGDEIKAPYLVQPQIARGGGQPKHEAGQRYCGNGDPDGRQRARGSELPLRGRQGIAGHRTDRCIWTLRHDGGERRAFGPAAVRLIGGC
ncbi:MAG: hypothetical protein M3Y43_09515 [Pseudomonadota bacterium]|nr:hypothetical protein [Pseudomonadota bacterium]